MPQTLISPPADEPVSLSEVKDHLRLDEDADDALVESLIAAARAHVERVTNRRLMTQEWRLQFDAVRDDGRLDLAVSPVLSVDAVRVYDRDGTPSVIDEDAYEADIVSVPARIAFAEGLPRPGRRLGGIEVDVTAGYGAAATEVPAPLRHAVKMLVAHWYEQRQAATDDAAMVMVPLGFSALVAPYRVRLL
ncbi:head-tail connector protein [Rhodobium gokarnense]|uniref:PhiE125 gp8 family phage protein n=1 Tax=Rhodobium gokarnense TaxID=364296 RepID=A0ABT3HBX2_9HYPH|nr:head-tail connector protein [Rhodobium gokarnense]MCW2307895.1 putative phiE125 gp8 family phage protein [Rhodobium gokarnense]